MAAKERVSIIGTGLIGTSIGLALKQAGLTGVEVVGHDKDSGKSSKAKKMGALDKAEWNLISAIEGSGLVILATPILAVKEIFETIRQYLPEGCVVTDTCSAKVQIMAWADELLPATVSFVGGHPMAGKETSGPDGAEAKLFTGVRYCLIPTPKATNSSVETMVGLVNVLGAKPYFVDAHEHDGFVAGISHLPYIASAALVSATTKSTAWREMAKLASSGYRDATRLAAGDPIVHRDICLSNTESIIRWIDNYIEELRNYRSLVSEQGDSLKAELERVQSARDKWLARGGEEDERSPMKDMPSTADEMTKMFLGQKLLDATKRMEKRGK